MSAEGYPSGQRGQTVNLLAHAFAGSNPAPPTMFYFIDKTNEFTQSLQGQRISGCPLSSRDAIKNKMTNGTRVINCPQKSPLITALIIKRTNNEACHRTGSSSGTGADSTSAPLSVTSTSSSNIKRDPAVNSPGSTVRIIPSSRNT